jgi:hypothetical protein
MEVGMKYLLLLVSLNVFAWNPTEIKVIDCNYGVSDSVSFSTSQKQFNYDKSVNGKQIKIFVEDTSKLSEIEDYVIISDIKGYKMTYSLKCKKVSK